MLAVLLQLWFLLNLCFSQSDVSDAHIASVIFLEDIQLSPLSFSWCHTLSSLTSVPWPSGPLALRRLQVQFHSSIQIQVPERGSTSRALGSKAESLLFLRFRTWSCFRSLDLPLSNVLDGIAFGISLAKVPEACKSIEGTGCERRLWQSFQTAEATHTEQRPPLLYRSVPSEARKQAFFWKVNLRVQTAVLPIGL